MENLVIDFLASWLVSIYETRFSLSVSVKRNKRISAYLENIESTCFFFLCRLIKGPAGNFLRSAFPGYKYQEQLRALRGERNWKGPARLLPVGSPWPLSLSVVCGAIDFSGTPLAAAALTFTENATTPALCLFPSFPHINHVIITITPAKGGRK